MMMNWKEFDRKQLWPDFKVLSQHSPGGTEEIPRKTSIRIAGRRGRDLHTELPEYDAGALATRPPRSVGSLLVC
jgi:hypothetical protein